MFIAPDVSYQSEQQASPVLLRSIAWKRRTEEWNFFFRFEPAGYHAAVCLVAQIPLTLLPKTALQLSRSPIHCLVRLSLRADLLSVTVLISTLHLRRSRLGLTGSGDFLRRSLALILVYTYGQSRHTIRKEHAHLPFSRFRGVAFFFPLGFGVSFSSSASSALFLVIDVATSLLRTAVHESRAYLEVLKLASLATSFQSI